MKQCSFCGATGVLPATTEYIYRRGGAYLIVSGVPCEECAKCGEKYYDAQTLRKIEQEFERLERAEKPPARTISVPVEEFSLL